MVYCKSFLQSLLLLIWMKAIYAPNACYVCNSYDDEGCEESPPPERYRKNCSETELYAKLKEMFGEGPCRKILQYVDFEINGLGPDERVVRTCGYVPTNTSRCYHKAGYGTRQSVCSCDTDFCNEGSFLTTSSVVVATCTCVAVLKLLF